MRAKTRMELSDWDSTPNTTNGNEGQHAWTNKQTGTRLSLLEAILMYVLGVPFQHLY